MRRRIWSVQSTLMKVHISWEGYKILQNLHLTFVLCSASQKVRWRFLKILWPFQNIRSLRPTDAFPVISPAAALICPPWVKQRDDNNAFRFVMLFAIIAIVLAQCLHFRYFEQEKRNEILMFSREIKCTLNIHCNRKTFQMSCIHASLKTKWQFTV